MKQSPAESANFSVNSDQIGDIPEEVLFQRKSYKFLMEDTVVYAALTLHFGTEYPASTIAKM
jgi:hypothetical protein